MSVPEIRPDIIEALIEKSLQVGEFQGIHPLYMMPTLLQFYDEDLTEHNVKDFIYTVVHIILSDSQWNRCIEDIGRKNGLCNIYEAKWRLVVLYQTAISGGAGWDFCQYQFSRRVVDLMRCSDCHIKYLEELKTWKRENDNYVIQIPEIGTVVQHENMTGDIICAKEYGKRIIIIVNFEDKKRVLFLDQVKVIEN